MIRGVGLLERIEAWFDHTVWAIRRRSRRFDHVWRAGERFSDVYGGRLAAAISYYSFFAAYSLGVLAFSIVGRLLGPTTGGAVSAVNEYLQSVLPWVTPTAQDVGRGQVTLIASVGLLLSGIGWVESLRSSMRAMWLVDQHPGHWALSRFVDLGMLVALGVLLGLSLATTSTLEALLRHLAPNSVVLAQVLGPALEFVVNLVLAGAMLSGVSRMRLSPRRLVPAALVIAVGIQLLNTVGRLLISRTEHRPAYAAVAGAVGLLVYLYVLNQVILFGTALAATARAGTAVDFGQGMVGIHHHGELVSGAATGDVGEPHGYEGEKPGR
jgi:membrane protein